MEWEETGAGLLTDSTGSSARWDAGSSPGGSTITLKLNDAGNYADDGNFMQVDTYAIQVLHHDRETSQDIGNAPACPPGTFGRGDEFRVTVSVAGMSNLIPVPDLKATNSFSRISDSGDLLRISSRLIQIWYQPLFRDGQGR